MKILKHLIVLSFIILISSCVNNSDYMIKVYETSREGNKLTELTDFEILDSISTIKINTNKKYQTITGFGGAFTESSAYLLNQMSNVKREEIINAYFSENGSNYSLTRTHMNSCDFSLSNYSYSPVEGDKNLKHFSVKEDMDDIIPMIKEAQKVSKDGFKIFASPWTAVPWMKDNNDWRGGKLLPEYYDTWALFFSKYADAYKAQGIDIWGFTVENEPHGNNSSWESMHYSPDEMTNFVKNFLGPQLEKDGKGDLVILGYDQNRADLKNWVDSMFENEESSKYFDGTAVHWYDSTYEYYPDELQYAHNKAPNKYLIQTEACIDSEIPQWEDDDWYYRKEATDWGYDWREEEKKYLHPKYAPFNRYSRDIIGSLNNWVDGWVDWNMILDTQGGPNWVNNWCVAPIIVDPSKDEIYYTPLYYVMTHFSKYIRPGAEIIDVENNDDNLMVSAALNPDNSIAVVLFNEGNDEKSFNLKLSNYSKNISISPQAIQTIIINQ
ncbi:glycoside hydrolase family 30 protein [Flavobacteriaceae bacterium]|nr:glycosyl hydrolase family 30 [Flavobacteriaceae bacterium]MDB9787981.1 glycosyl hydrolase family 30 [Flavobacteriaceae bacterium]MDB9902330.1 glycosyl hydrolase family 30 [Flavobacteriaceae bacterium]MDC0958681.1 glycoside hydrolase family 30 protein [Flavobacteriaceae bacterium]